MTGTTMPWPCVAPNVGTSVSSADTALKYSM